MNIDFSHGTISLVLATCDMRMGFAKLSALARSCLRIDVSAGNDWVVFVSKSKHVAKVIHQDEQGTIVITRKIHVGVFQQLLSKADGLAKKIITADELKSFLDGNKIEIVRKALLKG